MRIVALLPFVLSLVGCGGGAGESYPQDWALDVSPQAIELVEQLSWDSRAFYELVSTHAETISNGSGLSFDLDGGAGDLDGGAGVVDINGVQGGAHGVLGSAIQGTARADVNMVQIFNHLFGHAPGRVALTTYSMDEAARMVAVIVVHEVGHAMSLPHNANSSVMREHVVLEAFVRHAFTLDEVEQLLRIRFGG